jgi:hypothetical protein
VQFVETRVSRILHLNNFDSSSAWLDVEKAGSCQTLYPCETRVASTLPAVPTPMTRQDGYFVFVTNIHFASMLDVHAVLYPAQRVRQEKPEQGLMAGVRQYESVWRGLL